jgi:hypothetical protein
MTIFRALFWLTAVTVLVPQHTAAGRTEVVDMLGGLPVAAATPGPDLLGQFRAVAMQNLQRVKQERAGQKRMEAAPHPNG